MDTVNAFTDKVIRGKAKAMMVKIKRGAIDRPPMPEISEVGTVSDSTQALLASEEPLIELLVKKGLDGDMDEINALDNRVLRGKIKAAVVKAKRAAK